MITKKIDALLFALILILSESSSYASEHVGKDRNGNKCEVYLYYLDHVDSSHYHHVSFKYYLPHNEVLQSRISYPDNFIGSCLNLVSPAPRQSIGDTGIDLETHVWSTKYGSKEFYRAVYVQTTIVKDPVSKTLRLSEVYSGGTYYADSYSEVCQQLKDLYLSNYKWGFCSDLKFK